ncbi:hypothetical protein Tco_1080979 [Tanacetum coccineum]|uniref:Uncharacterized protein n=1 Tax=Tanacetum coccineum TaxID=301880 RepID=A0ABQ5HX55_9ASTR
MEECHKLLTDQVDDTILRYNVSKPLPLGGEPGHVTIQPDFFFNKDLEYLRYGRKVGRPALSISKMKAAYYPDVGLSNGCISVSGLKRKSVLEPPITREQKDSNYRVNLWTRNLVIRHRVEDFQLGIESYQTQLNLTKPRWEATRFEFKHDFTVIDSPRAVIFRDKYGVQMIMRFNEIHKFSDGTLQQIDEALDYRVKKSGQPKREPKSRDERQIFMDKESVDRSKDINVRYPETAKDTTYVRNLESFVVTVIAKATTIAAEKDRMRGNSNKTDFTLICLSALRRSYTEKHASMRDLDGCTSDDTDTYTGNPVKEKSSIKLWWKWRYHVPVKSIHSPMLTLNVFNQRHHDNQKTYNTASATLISNVMIKKSVSMPVRSYNVTRKLMSTPKG